MRDDRLIAFLYLLTRDRGDREIEALVRRVERPGGAVLANVQRAEQARDLAKRLR